MRCLYQGVHLTTRLCDQSNHTLGHKMSLPRGGSGWHFVWWAVSQPASLPAAIGQPTSHVTKYQPVRLQVGQIVGGRRTGGLTTLGPWPGSQHSHWFPLGEWPTWPRPGKWHKWALQPIIYHWHYFQGLFAVSYLHHLITYSCMKCREMLYRLFSLQTNSFISFHCQYDVPLHQGTTFKELLF